MKNAALLLFSFVLVHISMTARAQDQYTLQMLSQEGVNVISEPMPSGFKEAGDTSFTIYSNASVSLSIYFVNGPQYHTIFNPNPTGIIINGETFMFYCGSEMTIRQNFSNVLESHEFSFLGNRYLMLINFREDCLGKGCRYRCYNIFDITNPKNIFQTSFSSLFQGKESFGDYNNDGKLDFARFAPKSSGNEFADGLDRYTVTAYTLDKGRVKQLINKTNHPYYMIVKSDEAALNFQVLQADWFMTLNDTSGKSAPKTQYFAEYVSFDPLYRHLYQPNGVRVDKNKYGVLIKNLTDLEAAQDYCEKMSSIKYTNTYIMVDQYTEPIKYQVFVGNSNTHATAVQYQQKLKESGITGKIFDFRKDN